MENNAIKFSGVLFAVAIMLYFAHRFGLWPMLGGHPYWSASATYIGIAVGGIVASISYAILWKAQKHAKVHLAVFVGFALIAIAVSTYGKSEFVASYADDRAAGRLWYYAFIAFIAATMGATVTALRFVARRG